MLDLYLKLWFMCWMLSILAVTLIWFYWQRKPKIVRPQRSYQLPRIFGWLSWVWMMLKLLFAKSTGLYR